MDDEEENTEKNSSNRKPISYLTEFRLDINLNNFVRKLCPAKMSHTYIQTDRHTDPLMKWVVDELSLLKITDSLCVSSLNVVPVVRFNENN